MQKIAEGVYIETGYAGVTLGALALPHNVILIDAPLLPEDARSWRASLRNQGRGVDRLLVNLDAHTDRTLGARAMECPVIAHEESARFARGRSAVFKAHYPESGAEWETCEGLGGIRWLHPSITLTHRIFLHWGEHLVSVEHHPGPMSGAIWVVVPDLKVVFVGDAVLLDQPPFLADANIEEWVESLDLLLSSTYRGYTIVSGRGGLVAVETVRAQRRYLKDVRKRLERLAKRNAPPEATENLVPKLLSGFDFPAKREELYTRRLRYGLNRYYTRRYYPKSQTDQT